MFSYQRLPATVIVTLLISVNSVVASQSVGLHDCLKLGVEINHFSYEEPGVMEESGLLYGLNGSLSVDVFEALWLGLDGSIVAGDLTYNGSVVLSDGTEQPIKADTPNAIFNMRATGGIVFGQGSAGFELLAYSGLGYRLLVDDLSQASSDYGYTREQTYIYMPVGLKTFYTFDSSWVFSWGVEYDVLLDAENYSHGGALGDGVVLPQSSGYGLKGSVSMNSPRAGSSGLCFESFVEVWNIDDSEIVSGYLEPKNESNLFGVRCSVYF